jgi:O-antigen/teichoic acid export membrane protein
MSKNFSRIVDWDFSVLIIGKILTVATAVLNLRFATQFLSPYEYGRLAIIMSTGAFLGLILIHPVGMYFYRRFSEWHSSGILIRSTIGLMPYFACSCFIISGVSYLFFNFFVPDLQGGIFASMLIGTYMFFITTQVLSVHGLNALAKRSLWTIMMLLSGWVGLACSVYLSHLQGNAELWLVGQTLGLLVGLGFSLWAFSRQRYQEQEKRNWSQVLWSGPEFAPLYLFAVPLSIQAALNWLQFNGYRLFLGEWMGLESLGLFVAAYSVASGAMTAVESVLFNYFQPDIYRKTIAANNREDITEWLKCHQIFVPIFGLVSIFIVALAPSLMRLFLAERFHSVDIIVSLAAVAEFGRCVGNSYAILAQALMKTRQMLFPQMGGLLLVTVLLIGAVKTGSMYYIAASLLIASLLFMILMHVTFMKAYPLTAMLKSWIYITALPGGGIVLTGLVVRNNWPAGGWALDLFGLSFAGLLVLWGVWKCKTRARCAREEKLDDVGIV